MDITYFHYVLFQLDQALNQSRFAGQIPLTLLEQSASIDLSHAAGCRDIRGCEKTCVQSWNPIDTSAVWIFCTDFQIPWYKLSGFGT